MKISDQEPLQELKHDPVPGYRTIFTIVFCALGLYLALILISSPGKIDHDKGHGTKEETSHH